MAKTRKKIYYWDSCAFIAWLDGGEGHHPEVIAGLDEIAKEVNEKRAILCTSVNTSTEILQGKLTPEQSIRLQNLFKRRNVSRINVDDRIAQKASGIRNYYNERNVRIKTPDAQHLATAIIYEVDEFHTLDGYGERQRPNQLLALNGDVAGYPLHIRVPTALQNTLLQGVGPLLAIEAELTGEKNAKEGKARAAEPIPAEIRGSDSGRAKGQSPESEEDAQEKGDRPIKT